jgi:hypothetical protein
MKHDMISLKVSYYVTGSPPTLGIPFEDKVNGDDGDGGIKDSNDTFEEIYKIYTGFSMSRPTTAQLERGEFAMTRYCSWRGR